MKFGLAFASSIGTNSQSALEICRTAEAAGFDELWLWEDCFYSGGIASAAAALAAGSRLEAERADAERRQLKRPGLLWFFHAAAGPIHRLRPAG